MTRFDELKASIQRRLNGAEINFVQEQGFDAYTVWVRFNSTSVFTLTGQELSFDEYAMEVKVEAAVDALIDEILTSIPELRPEPVKANLGLATTEELLNELGSRIGPTELSGPGDWPFEPKESDRTDRAKSVYGGAPDA